MHGAASPAPIVNVANFRDDRLYPKIECAVTSILAKGTVVAPVDVLIVMGLLKPDDLEAWRRGNLLVDKIQKSWPTRPGSHAHD